MKAIEKSDFYKVHELTMQVNTLKYAISIVLELIDDAENTSSVDLDGENGYYFATIKKILKGAMNYD